MKRRTVALLGLLGALLLVGGVAAASVPDPSGVIHGCRKASTGEIRVIDSATQTCPTGTVALNWNQTGPTGPAGATGAQGPAGVSGYQVVTADFVWPGGSGSVGGTLEAACPSGKKVFGGGWRSQQLDAPNLLIHWSYPDTASNWWSIRYSVTDATAPFTLTSYAVCATA